MPPFATKTTLPRYLRNSVLLMGSVGGKVTIEFRSTALTVGGGITIDNVTFGPP